MGIADRDYTRTDAVSTAAPSASGRGTGPRTARRTGRGRNSPWRVTTWLIALNALIFVLGTYVITGTQWQPFGREILVGVTAADVSKAFVFANTAPMPTPDKAGVFARPLLVGDLDTQGRPLIDPRTGTAALRVIGRDLYVQQPVVYAWGHFSTAKGFFGLEVWRFVTFQFLHAGLIHLGFNLMGLYFVGYLVEDYLGSRRFLAFYLTCGIFGALMYLLLNLTGNLMVHQFGLAWANYVPFLLFDSIFTPLVGASAGIFGILLAAAFIAPDERIDVLFIIPMKMRIAVYGFTILALGNLLFGSSNAGGEAAHIGGAIAGFFFIRRMHLLRDFFDLFGDSRPPAHHAGDKAPRSFLSRLLGPSPLVPDDAEIERILKKISASGLDSLNDSEKETLKRHSELKRQSS
ncbi:MAG: rhomboid family intramembrane serine protease [Phycisphaerales bacterium]|nr:rhomboid family intramembrane serine protease [Phycisphaerales bacterium]